jgi:hypothetical protein
MSLAGFKLCVAKMGEGISGKTFSQVYPKSPSDRFAGKRNATEYGELP